MDEDLLLDGFVHEDTSTRRKVEKTDNGFLVHFKGDVSAVLDDNEVRRNEATLLNLKPDFDNEGYVHLGRIPRAVVDLWKSEGFDLFSAEQSGMTPEEHWKEVLKRLSGDWSKLNVSKYKRLA